MKFEVKTDDGYWSLYIDGVKHIDRESYTVVDQVVQYLNQWYWWPVGRSECAEVARSIMGG